jgi:predicted ArsR family transcriptional regulator
MRGVGLAERAQALRAIYTDGDPYMVVENVRGDFRLIEQNCPFLKVAVQRPALCSVTVSDAESAARGARRARGTFSARPRPLRFPCACE